VLDMGNLTVIIGLGPEMAQEGRRIHDSLNVYYLDSVVQYLHVKATFDDEVHHLGEHLVGMPPVVADVAESNGSPLPGVVVVNLGYGNVETVADTAGNGLDYLPFPLERHVFGETKADPAYTNIHGQCDVRRLNTSAPIPPLTLIYHSPR
jgi:hypothetical protein